MIAYQTSEKKKISENICCNKHVRSGWFMEIAKIRCPEANTDMRELGGIICLACTGVKMHASV